MASVSERRQKRKDGTLGPTRYVVRYRDPSRTERLKTFTRKVDADKFARAVDVDIDRGDYIDPRTRKTTFGEYAAQWQATRVRRQSSEDLLTNTLRRMAELDDKRLALITRSEVQAWVQRQAQELAPSTVRATYNVLSSIFRAAVDDGLINRTPCLRIALPTADSGQITPLTVEQVQRIVGCAPERYQALLLTCAGCGLRQGEALGLTVDRVNFLRRSVTIDRQMITPARGSLHFGPPKTPASIRTVPLPASVAADLAKHLERFGSGRDGLIFTNGANNPIRRSSAGEMMRDAVAAAGLPSTFTMHDLRHFYASLLISQGQSVKVIQNRLGHRSAVETLDTYGHLWPDSEQDTIDAVDKVLGSVAITR